MTEHRVILLAHGSSDPGWCHTFEKMAAPSLRAISGSAIAYMELSNPSLDDEVARAVRDGVTSITVLPLFLAVGRHLRKDVPEMLDRLRQTHAINIELSRPLGEEPLLGEAIKQIVQARMTEH